MSIFRPLFSPRCERARVWRFGIGLVSGVLLTSLGGAQIAAAPLTVPALWWAARTTPSAIARAGFTIIATLTTAVVGWAIAYLISGEEQPLILLVPLVAACDTAALFYWTTARRRPA